ncbi:TetR/AcrR family transcriptional regulator [Streptomyces sp. NPDC020965]|uniref:TetR/AcrR family transcriptional regulator n=1 Tax=Streptomyces sp. NPDC020965 TaxID=3365105 RepID=UPI0037AAF919
MGHREDLLEGAKRCLLEKGYARTTARDIVAASGANLASIGYHYGSKEALLQQAFLEVTGEWGEAVGPGGRGGEELPKDGMERFQKTWEQVISTFDASRSVWKLQLEVVSRLDDDATLREAIRGTQAEGRASLAEIFGEFDTTDDPEKARVAGQFYQALMVGVMIQWLMDPETAPTAQDLTEGLRTVLEDRP